MSDSINRHRNIVMYNEWFAKAAEALLEEPEFDDPEVRQWVTSISRQHRHHEKRHRSMVSKLEKKQAESDGSEVPAAEKTVQEQQADFAAAQEKAEAQA